MFVSVWPGVSIAKTGKPFLREVASAPLVCNLENALANWCFLPAQWTTSKRTLDKQNCHRGSRPGLSNMSKIYLNESWSVRVVSRLPSSNGQRSRTAETTARHSFSLVTYLYSPSLWKRNQYPTVFNVLSCCYQSKTHPTCKSQAPVSRVGCPFALGSAIAGSCTSAVLNVSGVNILTSSTRIKPVGWSFCSPLFIWAAVFAKFGMNRQNT